VSAEQDTASGRYKQAMADVFSRSAQTYGQVGPRIFTYFGQRLVELAQVFPGAAILDAAAGRGAVLFPAAEAVGSTGKAVGIDISAGMVRETAAEIRELGLRNAQVTQMDAENLDFPAGQFDFVLCGFAVFFFTQPDKALSGFWRVLKPGGILGVTTFRQLNAGEWSWLGRLVQAYSPPQPGPEARNEPKEWEFETVEGMQSLFSSTGFTAVQVQYEEKEFLYRDEEEWWAMLWSVRMREFFENLEKRQGSQALDSFKREAFSELARLKRVDGIPQRYPVLYTLAKKPAVIPSGAAGREIRRR